MHYTERRSYSFRFYNESTYLQRFATPLESREVYAATREVQRTQGWCDIYGTVLYERLEYVNKISEVMSNGIWVVRPVKMFVQGTYDTSQWITGKEMLGQLMLLMDPEGK